MNTLKFNINVATNTLTISVLPNKQHTANPVTQRTFTLGATNPSFLLATIEGLTLDNCNDNNVDLDKFQEAGVFTPANIPSTTGLHPDKAFLVISESQRLLREQAAINKGEQFDLEWWGHFCDVLRGQIDALEEDHAGIRFIIAERIKEHFVARL